MARMLFVRRRMRLGRNFACLSALLLLAACQAAPLARTVNVWVVREGGTIQGTPQERASAVARPLIACCAGRTIIVQVLATDAVGAFSWQNGRVFISRGLMNHLDDRELAAVIAHELGHLLSDGQLQTVASVKGSCADPDREVRADAAGVALLRIAGLRTEPMVSMLRKVEEYGSLPPGSRSAIDRRIALLSAEMNTLKSVRYDSPQRSDRNGTAGNPAPL